MEWACKQQNTFVTENIKEEDLPKQSEYLWNCNDNSALLKRFGPDYASLRAKLGHMKGLFDGVQE